LTSVLYNRSRREKTILEIYRYRNSPGPDKATLERIPLVSSVSRDGKIHDPVLGATLKSSVILGGSREVFSYEIRRPYRSQGT